MLDLDDVGHVHAHRERALDQARRAA